MFPQSFIVCMHTSSNYWNATGKEIKDRLDSKTHRGKTNMDHLLWLVIHWHKAIATFKLYYHLRCLVGWNICFDSPFSSYKSWINPSQFNTLLISWKRNFLRKAWPLLFSCSYILFFFFVFNFLATIAMVMWKKSGDSTLFLTLKEVLLIF